MSWDGLAFNAGITVGAEIVAVNGTTFDADNLKDVITEAKDDAAPIALLIKRGDTYTTASINYHNGLRYPRLERIAGTPALLDDLLSAKSNSILMEPHFCFDEYVCARPFNRSRLDARQRRHLTPGPF